APQLIAEAFGGEACRSIEGCPMPPNALNVPPHPRRSEILLHIELALAGSLLIIWTFLPHGWWHHVGVAFFAWPLVAYAFRRSRPRDGERLPTGPSPREEWRDTLQTLSLAIPVLIYVNWARLIGLHPLAILGSLLFFLGTILAVPSVRAPAQRYLLGWGV